MTLRRWVTAGLLALGLGAGSASATVFDTIDAGISMWGVGDLVQRYGQSRPGQFVGTSHTLTVAKAGKIIKWTGAITLGAELLNDALHWYLKQAQDAANPQLKNWYNDQNAGVVRLNLPKPADIPFNWLQISSHPNIARFTVNQYGGMFSYTPEWICGRVYDTSYNQVTYDKLVEVVASFQKQLDSCNPSITLDELLRRYPEIADDIKDALRRYLRNTHILHL